jgi:hypothetical protein
LSLFFRKPVGNTPEAVIRIREPFKKQARWICVYWFSGTVFWFPCVILGALEGRQYATGGADLFFITALPVYLSLSTLGRIHMRRRAVSRIGSIALWMLLGIWMLGPFCIMLQASFSGGGFVLPDTAPWLLRNFWVFPMSTFVMSTYSGTLGGLLIISIWLCWIAARCFSRKSDNGLEIKLPLWRRVEQ